MCWQSAVLTDLPQARNLITWPHWSLLASPFFTTSKPFSHNLFFLVADEFKITNYLNETTATSILLQAIQAAQGGSGECRCSHSHGRDVLILPNAGMESWCFADLAVGASSAFTSSKEIRRDYSSSSTAGWLTLKQDWPCLPKIKAINKVYGPGPQQ